VNYTERQLKEKGGKKEDWKDRKNGGDGGGGGTKVKELERKMENMSKQFKKDKNFLSSEVGTWQKKVEEYKDLCKKLQVEIGGMETKLFEVKEEARSSEEGRKKLMEAAKSAILGTSNDMGVNLLKLLGINEEGGGG